MKIIYEQNPLRSYIKLTEEEKIELKDKLYKYHRYEWEETEEDSLRWTKQQYPYVLDSLTSNEQHCGDCTKVPCGCNKCYAEEIWGINLTEGLKCFRYICSAFHKQGTTIDQAIENLKQPSEYNEEWHQTHIERWEAEKKAALDSLIEYKNKHFPK